MVTHDACVLIGDIHCINCGRLLGELVRNPGTGKLRLRAGANRQELLAVVERGRTLRCTRCQGRAFVEPVAHPTDADAESTEQPATQPPAELVEASVKTLLGVA